ncbi:MAG: hypothetical protein QY325_14055 [Flavobacteriales bacterium]|nr:MAG: hypothetical protein QY325_14055 [Flavobacteriales bacterium]
MAFWVTGWITILTAFLVLGWLLLRKKAQLPDILLIAIMAVVGFLETRLITSNPAALQGLFH